MGMGTLVLWMVMVAAQRYTEARMSKIALEMLRDINKNTVDFVDNYDANEREPWSSQLVFPNLLVNGATGIAVGMATNIPPHNLGETIDAVKLVMDNPEVTNQGLNGSSSWSRFPNWCPCYGEIRYS